MEKITEDFLLGAQERLKIFLNRYRDNKSLSKNELASQLGYSVPSLDKFLAKKPSSPISALKTLMELASVDKELNYDAASFSRMLLGADVSGSKEMSPEFLIKAQGRLRNYLNTYRGKKGISKKQLAEEMGCSYANVEKFCLQNSISSPINSLSLLGHISSIDDQACFTISQFIKMLLGTRGHDNKPNAYCIEIAELIQSFPMNFQISLKSTLSQTPTKMKDSADILDDIRKSDEKKMKLYKQISNLSQNHVESLSFLIETGFNLQGKKKNV